MSEVMTNAKIIERLEAHIAELEDTVFKTAQEAMKIQAQFEQVSTQLELKDRVLSKAEQMILTQSERVTQVSTALRNLMAAHKVVFQHSLHTAFRAGKSNFQQAWLAAEKLLGVEVREDTRQDSAVAPRIDGESRKGPSEGVQSTTQGAPASPSSSTTQQACIGPDKVHVDGNCPAHATGYLKPTVQAYSLKLPGMCCEVCTVIGPEVKERMDGRIACDKCAESAQAFERKPGDPDCPHGVVPRFCGRCSTVQDYPGEPSYCECADVGHGHKFGSAGCVNSVQKCICGGTGNCNGCNPEATAQDGDN